MSLFNIIKTVMTSKTAAVSPEKTSVTLGLHQGTAIELPELELILAKSDGSILPDLQLVQTINMVGKIRTFNKNVYNCYLSDGKSFIRLVTDNDTVVEMILFAFRDEIIPTSLQDCEFWLGKYQKDSYGEFVRDSSGVAIMEEYGLIGWPNFQVDGEQPIVYNRSWNPGTTGVEPVEYRETLRTLNGDVLYVDHNAMEYNRIIGSEPHTLTETLLVSAIDSNDEASVNIAIGIKLSPDDLKIFPA